MTTYTHKVIAYFLGRDTPLVSYYPSPKYPSKGAAMEAANQMKIDGEKGVTYGNGTLYGMSSGH